MNRMAYLPLYLQLVSMDRWTWDPPVCVEVSNDLGHRPVPVLPVVLVLWKLVPTPRRDHSPVKVERSDLGAPLEVGRVVDAVHAACEGRQPGEEGGLLARRGGEHGCELGQFGCRGRRGGAVQRSLAGGS